MQFCTHTDPPCHTHTHTVTHTSPPTRVGKWVTTNITDMSFDDAWKEGAKRLDEYWWVAVAWEMTP